MDLKQLEEQFGDVSVKHKITVRCVCGKETTANKEKIRDTIRRQGVYLCRSCSQTKAHQTKPRDAATHEKQRQGRIGKIHTPESRQLMSESKKAYFLTEAGIAHKKICSRTAAQGHVVNRFEKSKRKGLFNSKKNGTCIAYNSSYELLACVILEEDQYVDKFKSQVYYEWEGRCHSLDFLVLHDNDQVLAIEVKPKGRLSEEKNLIQLDDSKRYAEHKDWKWVVWTEDDLGVGMDERSIRIWADNYRSKFENVDYTGHRMAANRTKAKKHYDNVIAQDKVRLFCEFCQTEHEALRLTYDKNIARNGRYICEREGGKIAGSLPKLHLRKDNPYLAEGKKQCTKCLDVLLLEEFGDDKSRRDGKASRCRKCRNN